MAPVYLKPSLAWERYLGIPRTTCPFRELERYGLQKDVLTVFFLALRRHYAPEVSRPDDVRSGEPAPGKWIHRIPILFKVPLTLSESDEP